MTRTPGADPLPQQDPLLSSHFCLSQFEVEDQEERDYLLFLAPLLLLLLATGEDALKEFPWRGVKLMTAAAPPIRARAGWEGLWSLGFVNQLLNDLVALFNK